MSDFHWGQWAEPEDNDAGGRRTHGRLHGEQERGSVGKHEQRRNLKIREVALLPALN